jgi:hypothetical protein
MKPNDKKSILPVDQRPFSGLIIKGSGRNKYNCPGVDNKARMLIIKMADIHTWAIIKPVNWYAPASNVKLMFDRLVCMNGGNTDEKLMSYKDPEKAIALEKSEQWKELMINHPEGITTGFFCYSHHGNNELDNNNLPRILDYKNYFNGAPKPFQNMRQANAPSVWQCRYGNIKVPENVWPYADSGVGRKYSDDQSGDVIIDVEHMGKFENGVDSFEKFVEAKRKIKPGRYLVFGYKQPPHFWGELKTGLRALMLRSGKAPAAAYHKDNWIYI